MADPAPTFRLRTVEDPDPTRWHTLIESDRRAKVLHEPAVQRVAATGIRGARPVWLEVENGEGDLVAGLPLVVQERWGLRKVVSGASGLYGGPVIASGAEWATHLIARAFAEFGGWRTVRRELVWCGRTAPAGTWPGIRPLPTSVLRVEPSADFDEDYVAVLRPARRKERRRLLGAGYRAAVETGAFIDDFHPIYAKRCREWKTRPIPLETLRGFLACGDAWKGFVVRDEAGRLLGAHLCIDLEDELFAWMGTTERVEGGSLATLLIEEELRWCHAHGRGGLNLGTSADLSGVADFKRGISAVEDPRWILRWQRGKGFQ